MMDKQITEKWYMFLIKGIIMVILAVFVFFNPEDTLKAVAFYLGIGFFIAGIILVISGITERKAEKTWSYNLIEGIAILILGFLLVVAPLAMAAIIPVLIGIWAALYGFLIIIDAFKSTVSVALKLVAGIIILLLAYVLIFKPLLLGLSIVIWLGILLLLAGSFNILMAVKLKQLIEKNSPA
jgi:uncharacterized membrane protein HdeD (DUF308 family)